MKKTSKFISISLAALLALSTFAAAFAAEDGEIAVTLRIEGPDEALLDSTDCALPSGSTAADLILAVDEQEDSVTVIGAEDGYVSAVNDIAAGTYGGWDGWYFCVNGVAPDYGIGDAALSDGDDVVLYYGGYPCLIPEADTSELSSSGVITFTALETSYDENWNPIVSTVAVADMTVYFDGGVYTTDENGSVYLTEEDYTEGVHTLQIQKTDDSGAPAVLRFESGRTVEISFNNVAYDVNSDGIFDISDATCIQYYLANMIELSDESAEQADADGDGNIDINDVTYLQMLLAALI